MELWDKKKNIFTEKPPFISLLFLNLYPWLDISVLCQLKHSRKEKEKLDPSHIMAYC